MIRLTEQSLARRTYAYLESSQARSALLQEQLSSGRMINRPSDGPGAVASALELRNTLRTTEQYARNGDNAASWLTTADAALQTTADTLQRAREIAIAGSNATADQLARNAMAAEVRQIRDSLIGQANATYLGRAVFGGTVTGSTAYDSGGNYVGDSGTVTRRIGPGATVRADVDGVAVFGTGATSIFGQLDDLVDDLENNQGGVAANIAALDTVRERVLSALSDIGARVNRIDAMQSVNDDRLIQLRSQLSEVEDIDLPRTILELQLQETAYQAALGATARVIQPSLMDFLR